MSVLKFPEILELHSMTIASDQRKLFVVLWKSPLKTYAAVHKTSHSHLQVDFSAEKESNKKTYAAVHLTSHSHLKVVCSAEKESFKNLML